MKSIRDAIDYLGKAAYCWQIRQIGSKANIRIEDWSGIKLHADMASNFCDFQIWDSVSVSDGLSFLTS